MYLGLFFLSTEPKVRAHVLRDFGVSPIAISDVLRADNGVFRFVRVSGLNGGGPTAWFQIGLQNPRDWRYFALTFTGRALFRLTLGALTLCSARVFFRPCAVIPNGISSRDINGTVSLAYGTLFPMTVRAFFGSLRQGDDPRFTRPAGIQSLQNAILWMQEIAGQNDFSLVITTCDVRDAMAHFD
jgi:hypothetical protein